MKIEQLVSQLLGDLKKYYGAGELVVMVNSLGNVTPLEVTLIVNMVLTYLKKVGDTVVRIVSGPVMTSLDMNGISLTVLNVSKFENKDKIIQWLDAPVDSPFWPAASDPVTHSFAPVELNKTQADSVVGDKKFAGGDDDATKAFRTKVMETLEEIVK